MREMSRFAQGLAAGIILSTVGFFLAGGVLGPWLQDLGSRKEAQMLSLLHEQLAEDYVVAKDPAWLMRQGVKGMMASLEDPYSYFVGPQHLRTMEEESEGRLIGIGALVARGGLIQYPVVGGPAESAGLRPGDTILTVDGDDVRGMPMGELLARVKGLPGTSVAISLSRENGSLYEAEVVRREVPTGTVAKVALLDPEKGIGTLHLRSFARSTPSELDAALAELEAHGPLRGLILDLRFNTGGLLDATVDIASRFLDRGRICSLIGRQGWLQERGADSALTTHPDLPVVVLINSRSASGSEILAGALRDGGAAILVGEPSFGKGVYQRVQKYPSGEFAVKFTAGYYLTPSGKILEGHITSDRVGGLLPDISAPHPDSTRLRSWLIWDPPPDKWLADVQRLFPGHFQQAPPDPGLASGLEILRLALSES